MFNILIRLLEDDDGVYVEASGWLWIGQLPRKEACKFASQQIQQQRAHGVKAEVRIVPRRRDESQYGIPMTASFH